MPITSALMKWLIWLLLQKCSTKLSLINNLQPKEYTMKRSIYTLCLVGLLLPITSSALDQSSPANSLTVDTDGNVGVGTDTPIAKLGVIGDVNASFDGDSAKSLQSLFVMSANNTNNLKKSDVGFVMKNAREGFSWAFRTDEGNQEAFTASKQGTGGREFYVSNPANTPLGAQLFLGNGAKNDTGSWDNASSRSYKKNIHELSSDDAMKTLRDLRSVQYQYKSTNAYKVGFIAEDVPELVANKDRKSLDTMQIVAVLTKVLQFQDKSLQETKADIKAKDTKIAEMEEKLSAFDLLKQRLDRIEANLKLP